MTTTSSTTARSRSLPHTPMLTLSPTDDQTIPGVINLRVQLAISSYLVPKPAGATEELSSQAASSAALT
jgi:hypothetical protein